MYPQTLQKRVDKQKEHANKNLASWFMKKFSKKTQYLRDQDEESVQTGRLRPPSNSGNNTQARAKPRHISAVANANSQHSSNDRPQPQRQRSFLRAQLLEMKRESAETLLSTQQKRMAGEVVDDVPRFGTQLGLDASSDDDFEYDDDYDVDESGDESVRSVDGLALDDALQEMTPAEFRAIRKEKWQLKQSRAMDAMASDVGATRSDRAHSSTSQRSERAQSTSSQRSERAHSTTSQRSDRSRSCSSGSNKENVDALPGNRRISRATQMYADALSQIDHALHPDDHPPEPQPLFLGVTKKGGPRPKSEWI